MNIHQFAWVTILQFKGLLEREIVLQRFSKGNRAQPVSPPRFLHLHHAFSQEVRERKYHLRHLHLAVAFMRGVPYKKAEAHAPYPVNHELIAKLLPYDWTKDNMFGMGKREDVVRAWLDGDTPQWKKKFPRRAGARRRTPAKAAAAE